MVSIGIFDSGLGGLTVLREIKRLMPHDSTVYIGDTARAPYGSYSPDVLKVYGQQLVNFLLSHNVNIIVAACGTISSNAIQFLRKNDIMIIDIIKPAATYLHEHFSHNTRLGLIATEATIKSGVFAKTIKKYNPNMSIISKACPLFVPLIESGCIEKAIDAAHEYLDDMLNNIDILVLGCTHYPILTDIIKQILPVPIIDLGIAVAEYTKICMGECKQGQPTHKVYVTKDPQGFKKRALKLLNMKLSPIEQLLFR